MGKHTSYKNDRIQGKHADTNLTTAQIGQRYIVVIKRLRKNQLLFQMVVFFNALDGILGFMGHIET